MGTKDVRIDTRLNKAIWSQGVRGVPFRMRIRLARRILILKGTPLTPWDQMALFSLVSILTSLVPICFSANFLISLTALGALYLKPMPWSLLWRLMVYSLVTTSAMVLVFSLRTILNTSTGLSCRSESSNISL